jgi:hypothetical protein
MGLLYGLWYIISLALAMHLMHGGEWSRPFSRVRQDEAVGIPVVGVALFGARAILQHLVYENLWIAVFGMLVGIVAIFQVGYLWYNYHDDSDMGWPMLFTLLALLPVGQVIWTTTRTWSFLVNDWFWLTVVQALPVLIFIVAVAYVIAEYFFYQYAEYRDDDPSFASERRVYGWVAVVVAILAMILFVTGVIPGAEIDWQALRYGNQWQEEQQEPELEWPEEENPLYVSGEWTFYNNYLQSPYDEDSSNDYNFGANPIYEGFTAKDWYDPDFRARIVRDPALGAADIAWFDCVMGTRVLGYFHASIQGDWPTAINEAKERFIANPELYNQVCQNFFSWLDAAEVSIRYDGGLTDQMYMDPHTGSNVPDVIVMETTEHEGWFLVYRFQVKDNVAEVKYRLECGYQPTNVARLMNWTPVRLVRPTNSPRPPRPTERPTSVPEVTPTPAPVVTPTPVPTEKPTPTPVVTPTPSPKPTKDITQGTQGELVGKQDNPGPGESTNTGVGSQRSSKQEDHSSTDGNYQQYQQQVGKLEEANETPKPTAKPAQTQVNVDDNGGSADKPTPGQPLPHEAGTGNTINDQPGEAWGGPPD